MLTGELEGSQGSLFLLTECVCCDVSTIRSGSERVEMCSNCRSGESEVVAKEDWKRSDKPCARCHHRVIRPP